MAMDIAGISNSAEIFDPSSPDVTTHILEGFGALGVTTNDHLVKGAINYLKSTQTTQGSWQARWGVNYIYALGAVIPGLARVGYNLSESWVAESITWLLSKQNSDGGFGETVLSYNEPGTYMGAGRSTVSQTAWGLLALLEVSSLYDVEQAIDASVNYLLSEFFAQGERFFDTSVVGTGHRGILYL